MKISQNVQKALDEMGYHDLLPIQNKVIPLIQNGENLYVLAKTGSGKTASYLIPAIDRIQSIDSFTSVLVIAPTRELAIQISLEANFISTYAKVHVVTLIGGMDTNKQINALRHKPHIIIATPGRLLDLYNQEKIDLSHLSLLIIDEADQIYSTGQSEDVRTIRSYIPHVQTVCLSATSSELVASYFDDDYSIIQQDEIAVSNRVSSFFIQTDDKKDTLLQLLHSLPITTAIVFVNHRSTAISLSEYLSHHQILTSAFSGYFDERKRILIMNEFKKGNIRVLVATDAASRGLDITELSHVIHHDIPIDTETFIHRSGRTGHQDNEGETITLLTPEDMKSDVGMYIRMHGQEYTPQDTTGNDLSVPYHKEQTKKPNTQTLLIRAGKKDKIRPKDVIGALCSIFPFDEIGTLEIQDTYSTVTILNTDEDIFSKLDDFFIKGKRRKVEILKEKL